MPITADSSDVIALESRIRTLRDALLAAQLDRTADIAAAHPAHRRSAANLVHYVELRNHDIRELQTDLGLMGLSSLGRSEPYVLATIEAVLSVLAAMSDRDASESLAEITLTEGHELLETNATLLSLSSGVARFTCRDERTWTRGCRDRKHCANTRAKHDTCCDAGGSVTACNASSSPTPCVTRRVIGHRHWSTWRASHSSAIS